MMMKEAASFKNLKNVYAILDPVYRSFQLCVMVTILAIQLLSISEHLIHLT